MLLHVGLLVKSLAAILARVRSRIGVDEQMRRQSGRALESFPALTTLEHFLRVVQRSVML